MVNCIVQIKYLSLYKLINYLFPILENTRRGPIGKSDERILGISYTVIVWIHQIKLYNNCVFNWFKIFTDRIDMKQEKTNMIRNKNYLV